ncbi:unnamed protein product [Brassica rapa]|uniref:Uncharacterized protein n=3 Tax=Brassica TaxID=3705 RepID=M4FI48_BRACM|nr:unnamed protein product [Brassica napus]CAG7906142.1 unnamed protein product [Brassica rapa]
MSCCNSFSCAVYLSCTVHVNSPTFRYLVHLLELHSQCPCLMLFLSTDADAASDLVQVPSMLYQGILLLGLIGRATLGYAALHAATVSIQPLLIAGWCGLTTTAFIYASCWMFGWRKSAARQPFGTSLGTLRANLPVTKKF